MGCNTSLPRNDRNVSSITGEESENDDTGIVSQPKQLEQVRDVVHSDSDDESQHTGSSSDESLLTSDDEENLKDFQASNMLRDVHKSPILGPSKSNRVSPIAHLRQQLIKTEHLKRELVRTAVEIERDRQIEVTRLKLKRRRSLSVRRLKRMNKSKAEIKGKKSKLKQKRQSPKNDLLATSPNGIDSNEMHDDIKVLVENNNDTSNMDDKDNLSTIFRIEQIIGDHKQDQLRVESAESYERMKQQARARRKLLKRKTGLFFNLEKGKKALPDNRNKSINGWMKSKNQQSAPSSVQPSKIISVVVNDGSLGISMVTTEPWGLSIGRLDENNYYLQKHLNGPKCLKIGHILYSVNGQLCINKKIKEIKLILKNAGRPISLCFCEAEDLNSTSEKGLS